MASAFTHAFFAASLGTVMVPSRWKVVAAGALFAVLPDADVIAFAVGIPYAAMLGHRGLSHSLAFAAALALLLTYAWKRHWRVPENSIEETTTEEPSAERMAAYLFLAIASHGVLDALTNGGLGVAFFAPFSSRRYFFPWRPIVVSPISIHRFFSERGLAVLASELVIVWIPSITLAVTAFASRRWRRGRGED
jgi:inner membrane protein